MRHATILAVAYHSSFLADVAAYWTLICLLRFISDMVRLAQIQSSWGHCMLFLVPQPCDGPGSSTHFCLVAFLKL